MRVLLHICCAPCAIHPFQELSKNGKNSVTGFFYNPNVHPFTEMERRQFINEITAKDKQIRQLQTRNLTYLQQKYITSRASISVELKNQNIDRPPKNKEIAEFMGISEQSVANIKRRINAKNPRLINED